MAGREKTQEVLEKATLPTAEDAATLVPLDAVLYTTGHMLSWYKSATSMLSQEQCKFTSWEDCTSLSQDPLGVER